MSLILPASSSPDLKAFPLCSKSSKSSEGGQMSCLLSSELSAAAIASAHISAQPRQARLCDLFRSAYAPLHKSHRLAKARIKVVATVFLSVGLCQSRKYPYLPPEPLSVRLLPRPTCLPLWHLPSVSASAVADAKTAVKHHRLERTDRRFRIGAVVTVVPRSTAVQHGYIYIESVRRYSCHFTALLPMCIRLT